MLLILIAAIVLAGVLFVLNAAVMRRLNQDEIAPRGDLELPESLRDGDERQP